MSAVADNESQESYLSQIPKETYRLTWIDTDGKVLYNTQVDASQLENHKEREEVREAMISGYGSSSRYSQTMTQMTIYETVRLEDNTILRISETRLTMVALLLSMMFPIILVFIITAILAALLAKKMAQKIVEPLNSIDLDHPLQNNVYEELSPLLHRIYVFHREVNIKWSC